MAGLDPKRAKLRAIIDRRGMASVLNDTRWNVLAEYLDTLRPQVRAKLVSDDDGGPPEWSRVLRPAPGYLEPVATGPVLYLGIEWLEIDPKTTITSPGQDESIAMQAFLTAHRIPFSRIGDLIRIWGHVPPGVVPDFV